MGDFSGAVSHDRFWTVSPIVHECQVPRCCITAHWDDLNVIAIRNVIEEREIFTQRIDRAKVVDQHDQYWIPLLIIEPDPEFPFSFAVNFQVYRTEQLSLD